ncbi:hypothetical protein AAS21_gp148 [Pantoea phage vB_PagS_AAS21]|uniref:Uncharacterized protein n=1 Tax=Pantoea phage vB_PagS_AAS21 TaxID=2575261 RepID=A0A4Y5P1Q0_9CAUD|nr:hypothetical protein AAS21_gp148 [Pantoea phage vB_PagS_AAS21]
MSIFIFAVCLLHLFIGLWATKRSNSQWTLKVVFGKFLLASVITLLTTADVFLGGAKFPQLQVEVSSAIAIAQRELMTRV